MKGTAILFHEDKNVTIIEDIDHETYEEIKVQCGCKENNPIKDDSTKDLSSAIPALWHDDEVDWDYGY
jgi:hypothetical protein